MTNLTIIMGIVYLFYSAYFLSVELLGDTMTKVINVMLATLYFGFGLSHFRSITIQIR